MQLFSFLLQILQNCYGGYSIIKILICQLFHFRFALSPVFTRKIKADLPPGLLFSQKSLYISALFLADQCILNTGLIFL